MNKALIAALARLSQADDGSLPGSALTQAQRRALEDFAHRTGAVALQQAGRGTVYRVQQPQVLAQHLQHHSPDGKAPPADQPLRAGHIGQYRDSKGARHGHAHHYLLLKAGNPQLSWQGPQGTRLALGEQTRLQGAAALDVSLGNGWQCPGPLWLVENQALFDRIDWLPDASASLLYYRGQLSRSLLSWLQGLALEGPVVFFADYDGVGLANYCRLHAALQPAPEFWLMPQWAEKLQRYGQRRLWSAQLDSWLTAERYLRLHCPESPIMELLVQMKASGLGLEQEAVWL